MSKIFAEKLKYYRELSHMTQGELGHAVGITRNMVSNYELDRTEPTFDVLCAFADVLGVDITDLVQPGVMRENVQIRWLTEEEQELVRLYRDADPPIVREIACEVLSSHQKKVTP